MSDPENTITGTSASETLVGTSQNDFIKTNGGVDVVYGNGGDDEINARFTDPSDLNSKAYTYWYSAEPLLIWGGCDSEKAPSEAV